MKYSLENKKVWVAGHNGMVGAAIMRRLKNEGCEVLTAERSEVDLTRQNEVETWMVENKPDAIFLAAAKVGGIHANNAYPADFIYDNLAIETNIIHAAHLQKVEKLLFLGSSCIYPKNAPQPMKEEYLLTSELEPTNQWYAIAKIAGLKLCEAYRKQYGHDFISAMPTNLFGFGDNYHPENSHVPAAFLRRFHEAKLSNDDFTLWGTGNTLREFMYVDDLADACVFLMQNYSGDGFINIGSGKEISIMDFAKMIADIVGFKGEINTDLSKPDGTMRKLMDGSKLSAMGWSPKHSLQNALQLTYDDFCANGGRHFKQNTDTKYA